MSSAFGGSSVRIRKALMVTSLPHVHACLCRHRGWFRCPHMASPNFVAPIWPLLIPSPLHGLSWLCCPRAASPNIDVRSPTFPTCVCAPSSCTEVGSIAYDLPPMRTHFSVAWREWIDRSWPPSHSSYILHHTSRLDWWPWGSPLPLNVRAHAFAFIDGLHLPHVPAC